MDGGTYLRVLSAAHRGGHLEPRHVSWATGMLGLRAGFRGLVAIAQRMDDLLHPEWRQAPLREPVWIVAAPRSGTTLLHRLMSLDHERFTSMSLAETILPSVTARHAGDALGRIGRTFNGTGRRAVERLDRHLFGGWDGIHPMGLTQPEEDEALFVYADASPAMFMLSPALDAHAWRSVDTLPPHERERIMRFYLGCLRRHVYAAGGERRLLLKSTLAAARLDTLLEALPDSRFVHLIRHPYESVASALSMFGVVWHTHLRSMPRDAPEVHAFARLMMRYYRQYAELGRRLPPDRFLTVRYDDLVTDPSATVQRIYRHLDIPMTPGFRHRLADATRRTRAHRSRHRYDLAGFGITPDDVYAELADLFEAYGFARHPSSDGHTSPVVAAGA
jgi:omega-hydroxy-beta-dihydromenaquinone-9 sulfotransferase